MELEQRKPTFKGLSRLVHRRRLRRPARPRPGPVARLAGLGALHPMRPHRMAPPLLRPDPLRHRRRRLRPSPRRTTHPHPSRRRHRHPTRRMALARRRPRPLHGPPRVHRRRNRMGRHTSPTRRVPQRRGRTPSRAVNRGVTGQIIEDVEGPNPVAVVIDLDGNDELDITSAEALGRLADKLAKRGVPFAIAHLHGPAAAIGAKVELLDKVGEGHVFGNLSTAVRWATTLSQATGETAGAEPSVDGGARIHIDALLVTATAISPASRHRSRVTGALSPQSDNAQIGSTPRRRPWATPFNWVALRRWQAPRQPLLRAGSPGCSTSRRLRPAPLNRDASRQPTRRRSRRRPDPRQTTRS